MPGSDSQSKSRPLLATLTKKVLKFISWNSNNIFWMPNLNVIMARNLRRGKRFKGTPRQCAAKLD
jgi:hypothetical protein